MHVYIQLCLYVNLHCTFLSVNITLYQICMYLATAVNTYYSKATVMRIILITLRSV